MKNKIIKFKKSFINTFRKTYYFYITYSFNNGNGSIFITSSSKNLNLQETCNVIINKCKIKQQTIIITNFKKISRKFYKINNSKA